MGDGVCGHGEEAAGHGTERGHRLSRANDERDRVGMLLFEPVPATSLSANTMKSDAAARVMKDLSGEPQLAGVTDQVPARRPGFGWSSP